MAASLMSKVREIIWILPLLHSHWWFSACYALLAPFYPNLADSKGVPPTQYGYTFSVYKVGMLFGSTIADYFVHKFSAKSMYLCGLYSTLLAQFLFGGLYWLNDQNVFLGLSYAVALFGGIVFAFYSVSLYGSVTDRFSSQAAIVIASFEFLWGVGCMVGSAVGGVLVDAWAFPLPFFVLSIIMVMPSPYVCVKGVTQGVCHRKSDQDDSSDVNYKRLLWSPSMLIDLFTVLCYWAVAGFNEPTLEPYLRETFAMSPTEIGVVFTVQYGCYCLAAALTGLIWYWGYLDIYILISQIMSALSFVFIGPISLVSWKPSVGLVYFSQVLMGASMAGQFVGSYAHSIVTAIEAGYPDNLKTCSVITAWVMVFLNIGAIISPPVSAKLVEVFGYRKACVFLMTGMGLWALLLIRRPKLRVINRVKSKKSELEPMQC